MEKVLGSIPSYSIDLSFCHATVCLVKASAFVFGRSRNVLETRMKPIARWIADAHGVKEENAWVYFSACYVQEGIRFCVSSIYHAHEGL